MKAPRISDYGYTWEAMERMVHEMKDSGMTALCNVGYLLNHIYDKNDREHVPTGRLTTSFELGWIEDTSVERSEGRAQHPLSKPIEEIEQAHIRIMGGRTPFVPIQTTKAHALLSVYGPLGDTSNSHRDYGLRVFDRDLWLNVIKPHYEKFAQALVDADPSVEKRVERQRSVSPRARADVATDPTNGETSGLARLMARLKAAAEPAKG